MRGEAGYQNWKSNQPNSYGGEEDSMLVGRHTYQWMDSSCNEEIYYICQKKKTSFNFDTLSFVIGFISPLLFLLISIMCIIRLKQKLNKSKESPIATDHNYETISNKAPNPNHHSQISGSNILQETAGYEQPLPLTRIQINVESAYEPYNA
ncbi:uncharacterized protein LOC144420233 [Styela clava]